MATKPSLLMLKVSMFHHNLMAVRIVRERAPVFDLYLTGLQRKSTSTSAIPKQTSYKLGIFGQTRVLYHLTFVLLRINPQIYAQYYYLNAANIIFGQCSMRYTCNLK